MTFSYKKFNINCAVKVKLTEAGHIEMERQHNEFYEGVDRETRPFFRKEQDEDGYSLFQMHTLMNTFGHLLFCSNPELPFDTEIKIADHLLKDIDNKETKQ